jgi:short-subunit dehydrogenase
MGIFDGKSVVVTGAGTGIGAATSARIAAEGGRVALVGRREHVLRDTAAMIE